MSRTSYSITEQEYKILNLVAYGETSGSLENQYNSVNGLKNQNLTSRTVQDVYLAYSSDFNARGRYQFVTETLLILINKTGIDASKYLFNEVMQDFLALQLLYDAKIDKWKNGTCTDTGSHTPKATGNDEAFLMNLSRIWAAKPIPIAINDRIINKVAYPRPVNSTYYPGPAKNRAIGTASAHIAELIAIREAGPGQTFVVNFTEGRSDNISSVSLNGGNAVATPTGRTVISPSGSTTRALVYSAGGGQRYPQQAMPHQTMINSLADYRSKGIGTGTGGSPASSLLPAATEPYIYKISDPLDNRYDFRTGKKVIDLLVNGTDPASSYPINESMIPFGNIGYTSPVKDTSASGVPEDPDYNVPEGDGSTPPETSDIDPYDPGEFNPENYTVQNIIPASDEEGSPIAIVRSIAGSRDAEYKEGEAIFDSTEINEDGEVITITDIDAENKTVTLSNGDILESIGDFGRATGVVSEKINDTSPDDEIPEGTYETFRGSVENDLRMLNSLVRETTPYITVVPFNKLDSEWIYYISSDYYRDSSNRYPLTAYSPVPNRESGVTYATEIAKKLRGELPSLNLLKSIEQNSDHFFVPRTDRPEDPSSVVRYNNRLYDLYRNAGVRQGEIIAGTKKTFGINAEFFGLAKPEGGFYQNGGRFCPAPPHDCNYADYSHGTRIYWGRINLSSGLREGPITRLR